MSPRGRTSHEHTFLLHASHENRCPSHPPTSPISRHNVNERRSTPRSPLVDRAFDLNGDAFSKFTDAPTVPLGSKKDTSPGNHKLSETSTFHPLPPLPPSSSLQLSTLLDINFPSFAFPTGFPISTPPLQSSPPISSSPGSRRNNTPATDNSLFHMPVLSHPNSPYVPWESPVRREILRPLTPSSFVSHYSRPLSRSGARAPEPPETEEERLPQRPTRKLHKVSKSILNLRQAVRNVAQVTKRFKFAQKRRSLDQPDLPELPKTHWQSDPLLIARHRPRPRLPPPSPSSASFDSTNTNSLSAWLAARQCEAKEWNLDAQRGVALEEYDRAGSWINLTALSVSDDSPSSPAYGPLESSIWRPLEFDMSPLLSTCHSPHITPPCELLQSPPMPSRRPIPSQSRPSTAGGKPEDGDGISGEGLSDLSYMIGAFKL
ncbi:uncharacterized protein EV420DRAFT_1514091 [Desarmillaria tabescens]|uniref:Uncharacterized protein n=1 Tax=Armillaria tabescens TaxID=1929756 RepID=A0AA39NGV5_ARMTA|nr:uncharacterized protein EV420DRAFT_1514091 [Desarmillaria tabescens]KAK0465380.1 hypothetical protein EV420DRAFT_1514091 [Desarmillaria tabescens]